MAILTLGRLFTVNVAIQADHSVVETGLYRFVRHPSYVGLLLTFVGLGVFFANWLSLFGLLVPIALAVLNRMLLILGGARFGRARTPGRWSLRRPARG